MQRNYLVVTVLVAVIGVAFIFFPVTYVINLAPEHVTLWMDNETTQLGSTGEVFSFDTGTHVVDEGVYPVIEVWSNESVTLATLFILTSGGNSETLNITDNPAQCFLPSSGAWSAHIEGTVSGGDSVNVNAEFYYMRLMEPDHITYFPYRYFGYGMLAVGILASLGIYLRTRSENA